jgi:AcrR family transcriptional regulator
VPRILSESEVAGFRERLCDVAARIFIEKGRNGFNMRELAARLGVSAMTPYRYFKDKDEIFAAVRARAFSRFAGELEAALAGHPGAPGTPQQTGEALADAYMRFALAESASYRLMFDLSQPSEQNQPELAKAAARLRAAMTSHVRHLVEAGIYEGDAEILGQTIWAALHGAIVLHLAGKLTRAEFDQVRREAMDAFARAFSRA